MTRLPELVPMTKLLASVTPPAIVTWAELPEARVTSPVPKAVFALAWTVLR